MGRWVTENPFAMIAIAYAMRERVEAIWLRAWARIARRRVEAMLGEWGR